MKKIILIFVTIIVLILLGAAFILATNSHIIDEFEYRTSKYHTFGKVSVMVDGKEINISDVPLQMLGDNGDIIESAIINNNKFNIKEGVYGINEYTFLLPIISEDSNEDHIVIKIEHFNTSWWHVNDVLININISTKPSLKASMSGSISTRTKGSPLCFDFEAHEKDITQVDNILRNRTLTP